MFEDNRHNHNLHLRNGLCSPFVIKSITIAFVLIVTIAFYSNHSSNTMLIRSKTMEVDACLHMKDSLSAQLQVMYEHKSRLEKQTDDQKFENAKKLADVEKQLKNSQDSLNIEKQNAQNYQTQSESLQSEVDKLNEQSENNGRALEELAQTKELLQQAKTEAAEMKVKLATDEDGIASMSLEITQLKKDIQQCRNEIKADSEAGNIATLVEKSPTTQSETESKTDDSVQAPKLHVDGESVVFHRNADDKNAKSDDADDYRQRGVILPPKSDESKDNVIFNRVKTKLSQIPDVHPTNGQIEPPDQNSPPDLIEQPEEDDEKEVINSDDLRHDIEKESPKNEVDKKDS